MALAHPYFSASNSFSLLLILLACHWGRSNHSSPAQIPADSFLGRLKYVNKTINYAVWHFIFFSLFITCGCSLCCYYWPSGGGGSPDGCGCLESCLWSSGWCFHDVIQVKDLIFQDEWASCILHIVAVVSGAETGLDWPAAIISDVTHSAEVLRGQRIPDVKKN